MWLINPGKRDGGIPPTVLASWTAEWHGGGAKLAAGSREGLLEQIAQHPLSNGADPASVIVESAA